MVNFVTQVRDPYLNGETILSEEFGTMLYEPFLPLVEPTNVREDMLVVEQSVTLLHLPNLLLHLYNILALSYNARSYYTSIDWHINSIYMKSRTKNFEIISKLGSGSYGIIFKTLNKATKEVCVLKQITLGRLSEKARRSVKML